MVRWSRAPVLAVGWLALLVLPLGGCGLFESTPPSFTETTTAAGSSAGSLASGGAPLAGSAGASGGGQAGGSAGTTGMVWGFAQAGSTWVSPVAPEVSQHWSWLDCGRIGPGTSDMPLRHSHGPIRDLALSADGSLLASDADFSLVWHVAASFEQSESLFKTGGGESMNVALSPDGRFGTFSGDVRLVFDAKTGEQLFVDSPPPPNLLTACIGTEFNFSPDSHLVAGKRYTSWVDVIETDTFSVIGGFSTSGCGQGIAFSADSQRIVAPDGASNLAELSRSGVGVPGRGLGYDNWISLTRAPDGGFLAASCLQRSCQSEGLTWEQGGRHVDVSAEQHWLVLGGKLRHVPSGEERTFDEQASEALFAPNGDIIAGEQDGSLVRFCRAD